MIKKVFLAFLALIFVLIGTGILMMGYFFTHPSSIFNAIDSVTTKLTEGEAYEETEEYFLQGIKSLEFLTEQTNIEVLPYDEPNLKVQVSGKIPHFERGPFLLQSGEGSALAIEIKEPIANNWVHININGRNSQLSSDSRLTAKIYLPKRFLGNLTIETNEGAVKFHSSKDKMYEFDLQSVTGSIKNQEHITNLKTLNAADVGKVKITTNSGNILVEN
jgi:hypothetical protein